MNNVSAPLFVIAVLLAALINLRVVHSLGCMQQSSNRRQFVTSSFGSTCIIISTAPALADEEIASLLDAKTMYWNGPSWTTARYRSSTLKQSSSNYAPPASNNPVFYATWMEGYHKISYKFKSASFPQGRKILTLRTPGAGLGSCLMLPNIGYNPSSFPIHFISSGFCTLTKTSMEVHQHDPWRKKIKYNAKQLQWGGTVRIGIVN